MSRRSMAAAVLIACGCTHPAAAQFKTDLAPFKTDLVHFKTNLVQFKKDLPPVTCANVDSIGTAEMAGDGTITLHLRSLWPSPSDDSDLSYAPDDPQYDEIKKHLGGIDPGQSKPIPPFC